MSDEDLTETSASNPTGHPAERLMADWLDSETTGHGPVMPVFQAYPGCVVRGKYRYVLRQTLGRGGYGAVWRATSAPEEEAPPPDEARRSGTGPGSAPPPQQVAIKLFHVPRDHDLRNLVARELTALLALRHPRIVRIYDWSLERPASFLALELHDAGSLKDVISFHGAIGEDEAWRLLQDLLEAISAAHQESILHLDLKPSNVLIGQDGRYVLTDFGVSQATAITQNIMQPGLGTVGFQAPEQKYCDPESIDYRTDLWGVGMTVWTALTATRPDYCPQLFPEMGDPGAEYGMPDVRVLKPEVSQELGGLVMGLLKNDPNARPGSAAEVLEQVRAHTTGLAALPSSFALKRLRRPESDEVEEVVRGIVDPVWTSLLRAPMLQDYVIRFDDGETMGAQGDRAYYAFVLLRGCVRIILNGQEIAREEREGTILGEVAALTGMSRTSSMVAEGEVWALVFNASELEKFMILNPAIGLRMLKTLAWRLYDERERKGER